MYGLRYMGGCGKVRALEKKKEKIERQGQTVAEAQPGVRNEYLSRRFCSLKEHMHVCVFSVTIAVLV